MYGRTKRPGRVGAVLLLLAAGAGAGAAPLRAQDGRPGRREVTLEDAVALALRHNRELRRARLGLESAEGRVDEAWGNVYPRLNLDAAYTRSLSIPGTFLPRIFFDPDASPDELVLLRFGQDNAWSFQLRVEQPLFQAAAFLGVGAAGRYRELQRESVRGVAQDVVTRTRIAFYDVLLAREAVRLSDNSVRRVRQVLEETRAMQRVGLASDYDVLRLEVELANLESNLRRARNSLAAATRTLGVELGLDDPDGLEAVGSLAELAAAFPDGDAQKSAGAGPAGWPELGSVSRDELLQLALRNRSDLRQLELTASLRETELKVERSAYLPKVSLFGTYSITAQQSGDPDFFGASAAARAYGREIGIQVSMPLFSGFQRPARIAQKQAALQQVWAQHDLAEARAENQVLTLLDQLREAGQRARAQRLAVRQAERGFEIASAKYREGLSSQLEVTDAGVALRQSEFNHAEALYDYLVARARLDQAVGRVPLVDTGT
ncbi:MAG TPA: TolC family protein [Longimicrobiales bacterium]